MLHRLFSDATIRRRLLLLMLFYLPLAPVTGAAALWAKTFPFSFSVFVLVGGPLLLVALGRWMLGPLMRASAGRNVRPQFTIADFFGLILVIQISLGLLHLILPERSRSAMVLIDSMACGLCGLVWFKNVRRLSQMGIEKPAKRMFLLTMVLPIAYWGVVALPVLVFVGLGWSDQHDDAARRQIGPLLLLIALLLPLVFWWAATFVRRTVAESLASRSPSE